MRNMIEEVGGLAIKNNSINTEEIIKYITHLSTEEKESVLRAFPSNLLVGEIYNRINAYEEKLNIIGECFKGLIE